MKKNPARLVVAVVLFLAIPGTTQAERVVISEPTVYPASVDARAKIVSILKSAAAMANGLYGQFFEVAWHGADGELSDGSADYALDFQILVDEQNPTATITARRIADGAVKDPFTLLGALGEGKVRHLANIFFYLWASFHDFLAEQTEPPPRFVDELQVDLLARSLLPNQGGFLMPTAVAVKGNGNLVAAFSSLCVEFDRHFRVVSQPGRELLDSGNYTYAYWVSVTPGDTLVLKPSMGRELYRVIEGAPRALKWRTGLELTGPFTVLPDGSVLIVDQVKKRAHRLDARSRKRYEIDIFQGPYAYITAVATGPEGNIWVFDAYENRVRIYSAQGELIDSIMVLVDRADLLSPWSIAIFTDGRFVLFSNGELLCFRRDGTPVWRMTEFSGADGLEPLPQLAVAAVDSLSGIIYLSDQMGKRILKFLDGAYASTINAANDVEQKILELNRQKDQDMSDTQPIMEKAVIYEQLGAFEMAQGQLERVLDRNPFDGAVQAKMDQIEVAILLRKVSELRLRTLDALETLGPASAQMLYNQTLQQYERILSMSPDREDARKDLEDLKAKFLEKSTVPTARKKPLAVVKVNLKNLFPSLMQYYRQFPAGEITVKNTLDEDVTDLVAELSIRKYMDFPTRSEMPGVLKPGDEATLDFKVLFNDSIFGLQEDLPVQARVELSYRVGATEQSVSKDIATTIYRRTALSWDDSGKIASFIMPNEGIVSQFSHLVSDTGNAEKGLKISEKFFRAMKIADALGAFGVNYVEDPESPFSRILGKAELVDTVRFPRTTLLIRSGDCDDTTALLGSLLESSGIRTAVMTSPGHVFLGLDTGEPEENLWLFKTGDLEAIRFEGTVWLPLETTVLGEGFAFAWAKASELVRAYQSQGSIEFLPVHKLRDKYPPLPLPESSFTVVVPEDSTVQPLFSNSVSDVTASLYRSGLEALGSRLAGQKKGSRKSLKLRNQVGVLHARFGRDTEAEKELRECISENPDFLASYVNLANIKLAIDEVGSAVEVIGQGLDRRPDSALLNLLMARSLQSQGEAQLALEHYDKVRRKSPALAERYAALFDNVGVAGTMAAKQEGRAGITNTELPFIWDEGED